MEVEKVIQREYNPSHPNYERWQKGRELSDDRAKFVESVLANEIDLKGLKILDLGAGEGSTSRLLSKNNFVISLELKSERVNKISVSDSLNPIIADGFRIPVKTSSIDIIILQDVLEHMMINSDFIAELHSLLKDEGIIYLSTPNKISLFNIISDPHWGMPLLSLFNRKIIKKYFLKNFRRADYYRNDIAELFSLKKIVNFFNEKFSIKLYTKQSLKHLLDGRSGLVWSKFHIYLLNFISRFGLKNVLLNLANDNHDIINKYFTPTFYIILKKK
jgi:2-polyprenyl-3-methyl-5-hydroxy-6-metoxy-1,4-benzoquinol methylase